MDLEEMRCEDGRWWM